MFSIKEMLLIILHRQLPVDYSGRDCRAALPRGSRLRLLVEASGAQKPE